MRSLVLLATIAVWLTAFPGLLDAKSDPGQGQTKHQSRSEDAVQLKDHINGVLASKCQATYTRNLAGTDMSTWEKRHIAAHKAKNACVSIKDWRLAVMYVQRWFPGTASWLLSCSASEGGHGPWVPNRQGSGAGGWMQYMSGTFYTDFRGASAYLAARGVIVPRSANSWYSALGQAIAAGWARYTGHAPRGKWTGASC